MSIKALDLFQAFTENKLPTDGGYIVSSFLSETTTYSRYEVVAYHNVKNIYQTQEGLTFQSDGNKIHVLVEPPTYSKKYIEPFRRDTAENIPLRFSELDITTARDQSKVMVNKDPIMSYGSFTVMRPTGINFAFIFYNRTDIMDSMKLFFTKTLNAEAKVPKPDATKAAASIMNVLEKFTIL